MAKPPFTIAEKLKTTRSALRSLGTRRIFMSGERMDDPGVVARPFRSAYFVMTSAMGLGCVALDGYVLRGYSQYFSAGVAIALIAVVGMQVAYQVTQMSRVIPLIREFDRVTPDENLMPDSPLGDAIEAAVLRFVDKLFFSYGMTLTMLILLAVILSARHPA